MDHVKGLKCLDPSTSPVYRTGVDGSALDQRLDGVGGGRPPGGLADVPGVRGKHTEQPLRAGRWVLYSAQPIGEVLTIDSTLPRLTARMNASAASSSGAS